MFRCIFSTILEISKKKKITQISLFIFIVLFRSKPNAFTLATTFLQVIYLTFFPSLTQKRIAEVESFFCERSDF